MNIHSNVCNADNAVPANCQPRMDTLTYALTYAHALINASHSTDKNEFGFGCALTSIEGINHLYTGLMQLMCTCSVLLVWSKRKYIHQAHLVSQDWPTSSLRLCHETKAQGAFSLFVYFHSHGATTSWVIAARNTSETARTQHDPQPQCIDMKRRNKKTLET